MSNNPARKISRQGHAGPIQKHRQKRSLTPWLVGIAAAAVLALAVLAGVLAGGEDDDLVETAGDGGATAVEGGSPTAAGGAPSGFAEVLGTPLPELADEGADPAVGQPAPDFRGVTFDGVDTIVDTAEGPALIAFVAHWCPHCQAEIPVLVDWLGGGGLPADVRLVMVSTAVDPAFGNHPPEAWLAREGYPLPVIADSAENVLQAGYGVSGFPFWTVVGAEGDVVLRTSGEKTPEQLDAMVAAARG